ncbi:heavy metal-associated isoprenylated plant protein 47-like [Vigna unguiculata]|uniref:heavy metal-associated isoprenylated plant protein 47-like n=1 Tax=Vigna unguiculata TaxID=3917 RepID=UPI0010160094|nr:heavy metal-associated isoprenylated plant protein 47-like [Vigna unguiculata]
MKKIVIQVHMENDKCRSKAMKIAAASQGVHSVALEGEDRDQVVVTGDAIDSVCLTNKFRKKFNYATLMSVTEAKASNDGDAGGEHKDETTAENFPITYCYSNFPPPTHLYVMDYDPYPNGCSIL